MSQPLAPFLRRTQRLPAFLAAAFRGLWQHRALPPNPSPAEAADWLHRACAHALPKINVQVLPTGRAPSRGLIVSNHLSYLDIVILSACLPVVFVSKAEVQSWPIFGRYARWAGSVFVRRHDKADIAQANAKIESILRSGVPVLLFPEGTTSDGRQVQRFHSTMLQPAIDAGCTVTPCAIVYELDDGDPGHEVSWWGDMSLVPHVMNLLGKKTIRARVAFGEPMPATGDRKQLGSSLRDRVVMLRQQLQSHAKAQTANPAPASALQEQG